MNDKGEVFSAFDIRSGLEEDKGSGKKEEERGQWWFCIKCLRSFVCFSFCVLILSGRVGCNTFSCKSSPVIGSVKAEVIIGDGRQAQVSIRINSIEFNSI